MAVIEHYAKLRGVWKPEKNVKCHRNGETVTNLWDGIWNN